MSSWEQDVLDAWSGQATGYLGYLLKSKYLGDLDAYLLFQMIFDGEVRYNQEMVDLAIEHTPTIDLDRLFFKATSNDCLELMQHLITLDVDVNKHHTHGRMCPLHIAISIDAVHMLLEHGADVNARNASDETPLHLFCENDDDYDIVKLLLEHGADVHAMAMPDEWTPIMIANQHGCELAMTRLLIQYGANPQPLFDFLPAEDRLKILEMIEQKTPVSGTGTGIHAFINYESECSLCYEPLWCKDITINEHGCGHGFHGACVEQWFQNGIGCPICRASYRMVPLHEFQYNIFFTTCTQNQKMP